MGIPSYSPEEIAAALQRFCGLTAAKAAALATAGLEQIRSPWSVPGMAPLVERLVQALQRREPLLLFGDFDTDGVTGSAVLYRALGAHSDRVRRYNPVYQEGYGLHPAQVDRFASQGIRLIVTVDTGISSLEAVARARQLGLEVLITDHHLPLQDPGPPDTFWIDPPDHLLSGAQLAYLVAWALRERLEGTAGHDPWGLALSAVGAQMDWVPVDEPETRAWVAAGQALINSDGCPPGLRVLRDIAGRRYIPSEMRSLGGVLNMAKRSRLVEANTIVEALLPETADERRLEIYQYLSQESARTRRAVETVTAQAMADVRSEAGRNGLLLYEVHVPDATLTEVEGPLTSRIVAETGRPTLVLRPAEGCVNFSGRARGSFSFESFLNDPEICSLVEAMGGHRQAIGGSFLPQNQAAFLDAVRRWAQAQPTPAPTAPRSPPEPLETLDPATAHLLGRAIGPFGHRLRRPVFRTALFVRGGWAGYGDYLVELDRPLWEGDWQITFRFDEAGCDGQNVALRVEEAERVMTRECARP
jgi:single-stranded-DNA-specific exonuclease